jgi:hypothetical protein
MVKSPEQVAEMVATIQAARTYQEPFAVAMTGVSAPDEHNLVASYAAAGVTWWLESIHGFRGSAREMEERIAAGPPA